MNAIEFFNSKELELPKSWDKASMPFHKFLRKAYDEFLKNLERINDNDFISLQIIEKKDLIKRLTYSVYRIVQHYLKGELIDSYKTLEHSLDSIRTYIQTLIINSENRREFRCLFRIRLGDNYDFSRQDLFHTPYELRHKISTKRYSIPGLPTLYLGGSIFICWEEMNRPNFTKIHASKFSVINNENLRVLDFGYRPTQIASFIQDPERAKYLPQDFDYSNFAIAYTVCWPLIAACSIVTKEKEAPFKPEYIIPQLILQWVRKEKDIDGIRYFSTRVIGNYEHFGFFLNYAFPVRDLKDSGYCDSLKRSFSLTEPLHWSIAESFNMGVNPTINQYVRIQLLNGEEVTYMNSKFEAFEEKLCGKQTDRIP